MDRKYRYPKQKALAERSEEDQETIAVGTITKLEWQKKNKDRLNVFLDQNYAFSCHVDLVLEFRLDKGLYLDEELVRALLEADALKRGYLYGLKSVLMKDQTSSELKRKMAGKAFSVHVIETIIERLTEEAYLDDVAFAIRYVEARSHLYGVHRLRQSLKLKGLSQEVIESALHLLETQAQESESFDEDSEWAPADPVLEMALKKMRQCQGLETQKMLMRVTGFLQRRGYDHQTVRRVMNEVKEQWRRFSEVN